MHLGFESEQRIDKKKWPKLDTRLSQRRRKWTTRVD